LTQDDEAAFADYVTAQSRRLRDFAYLLCGDWHAAEDAVQTALARLFVAWRNVRDRSDLNPYVRRIIVHLIVDRSRRAWFRREASWAHPPEATLVRDPADATSERMAVLAALAKVPPRQRAVLVLRYWEDQSVPETAEALRCSEGTVKSQAARGLQTLRELLGDQFTPQRSKP